MLHATLAGPHGPITLYLFFKAYQPGLFDSPVEVSGHVTKRGTVVAPYRSTRKKRPAPPPAPDLFAEADRRAMEEDRKKAEEAARQEKERQEREAEAAKKEAERKAQEEAEKAAKKAPLEVTGRISLSEIKVGDLVQSSGDKRVARTGGKVTKTTPSTLTLTADYMGTPLELKIKRGDLAGEVRVLRDGKLYSTSYLTPEEKRAQEAEAERAQKQEAEREAAELAEFIAARIKSVQESKSMGDLTARTKAALGDIAGLADKIGYDGVAEHQSKIREAEIAAMKQLRTLEKAFRAMTARYLFLKAAA